MQRILTIHRVLANVAGFLVLVLILLIVVDAGGRFLFNKPFRGGTEISKILLAWVFFLPFAYALIQGTHVRITLVLTHLPHRLHLVAEVLIDLLSLVFLGLVVYASGKQFWESFIVGEVMAAPIWVPFWAAKLAVPVGCLLLAAQFSIHLVAYLQQLVKRS
jgi:TRAP-type C4-dicarboxylate transport system permease small subunit